MKKVKIYVNANKRLDFIPLQQKSFLRFLKDDFEYIIFNNADTKENNLAIKELCKELGIKCIDVEGNDHRHPTYAGTYPVQWSFHKYIKQETDIIAVMLDSDIFMIKEFSVNDYMNGFDVAAIPQFRHVTYLHIGIMFFNMDTLPNKDDMNFMHGKIEGALTDGGGYLYYWLKDNPGLRVRYIVTNGIICSKNNNLQFLPAELVKDYIDDYQFGVIEKTFLHYRRGSNWDRRSEEFHKNKTILLKRLLKIVNENESLIIN